MWDAEQKDPDNCFPQKKITHKNKNIVQEVHYSTYYALDTDK